MDRMGNLRPDAAGIAALIAGWLAGALPASAQAAGQATICPGPWDRDAGIRAVYADGSRNDFVADPQGMIRLTEPEAAAEGRMGFVALSRLGLYDVEIAALGAGGDADPDRRLVTVYSEPAETLPEPVEGESWTGAMTTVWPDGSNETATAVYVFGRLGSATFGSCRYDVIPVRASFIPWPETAAPGPASALELMARDPASTDWVAQEFLYFPTLALAVLTVTQEAGVARLKRRELASLERLAP